LHCINTQIKRNIMKIVLKQDILNRIKSDPILYGKVASEVGVVPMTLPRLLYSNDPRLTQAGILEIIKSSMGISSTEDLLETVEDEDNTSISKVQA